MEKLFLRSLLENSFNGILIFDLDLRIQEANPAILNFFEQDIKPKNALVEETFPFSSEIIRLLKSSLSGQKSQLAKQRFRSPNQAKVKYYDLNISPNIDDDQHCQGGILILNDVSELHSKEKSLTKQRLKDALKAFDFSNDRLKWILNSSQDFISAIDPQFHFVLFNEKYQSFIEAKTGKKINIGVNVLDCYRDFPEEKSQIEKEWRRVLKGDEFQKLEEGYNEGGQRVFLESQYSLVKDRDGKVMGASKITRDITDRLQTEELWQASERRFSKIFNESIVGFALIDTQQLNFVQVNPALAEMLDYDLQGLSTKKLSDISHPDDFAEELSAIENLEHVSGSYKLDKRLFKQNGEIIWVTVSGTSLFESAEHPDYILLVIENITQRKEAQKLLLKSEAQKSALIDAFPDTIFHLNETDHIVQINDRYRMLPYQRQDVLGKTIDDFTLPKKIRDRVKHLVSQVRKRGQTELYECEIPTPAYTYALEVRFVKIGEDEVLAIVRDITQRKREELRTRELLKQANWLNQNLEEQNDKLAQQEKQLRKQNEELELTTQELRSSQIKLQEALKTLEERNFELDQFVYKTSHDLRSPLSSVLGILNLVKIDPDINRFPDYARRIEGRILRLDDFIQSMLHYSRNHRAEFQQEAIDFQALLQECEEDLQFYKNFDEVDIRTEVKTQSPELVFYSDRLRLKIVLANIISNAIKYQDFNKQERFIKVSIEVFPQSVKMTFEDNGIGIDPHYQKDIFNMFFRATEEAEGSGLGLYIVKQTVDKLAGKIHLVSEGNQKGLCVFVEIPNLKPRILND